MKNEIQSMTMPKIKRMIRLRLLSMVLSVLFTLTMIGFLFGKQGLHWNWAGSLPLAAVCVALAAASCVWYLILDKKLASGGL